MGTRDRSSVGHIPSRPSPRRVLRRVSFENYSRTSPPPPPPSCWHGAARRISLQHSRSFSPPEKKGRIHRIGKSRNRRNLTECENSSNVQIPRRPEGIPDSSLRSRANQTHPLAAAPHLHGSTAVHGFSNEERTTEGKGARDRHKTQSYGRSEFRCEIRARDSDFDEQVPPAPILRGSRFRGSKAGPWHKYSPKPGPRAPGQERTSGRPSSASTARLWHTVSAKSERCYADLGGVLDTPTELRARLAPQEPAPQTHPTGRRSATSLAPRPSTPPRTSRPLAPPSLTSAPPGSTARGATRLL